MPEPEVKEEEEESLEYRNDGYIELVLKVMARMCDGQNHQLQVWISIIFFSVIKTFLSERDQTDQSPCKIHVV